MRLICGFVFASLLVVSPSVQGYPLDDAAQKHTKIRRLKWQQDVDAGIYKRGRKNPPGGQWGLDRIKLRMTEEGKDFELTAETPKDPELQAALEAILKKWKWKRYNIALLDITDQANPRYAAVNEMELQTPGSVAKILVAAGLFNELKKVHPTDTEARKKLLQETIIAGDDWAMPNHHEVPVIIGDVYSDSYKTWVRRVKHGDKFSLWEWIDHALSPSSNAAASTMWREAILLRQLGAEYPPEKYDNELYKRWDKEAFTEAAFGVVNDPLSDAGLGVDDFYVRMFFTKFPARYIKSQSSRANPFGLVRWMLKVEQGRLVDEWSSLELKRLLYLTRRRVRYVYSRALRDSAVWFKSGSLYGCVPEEGFKCGKFRGNSVNVLNGLIEVETDPPPPPEPTAPATDGDVPASVPGQDPSVSVVTEAGKPYVYIVAVMSNELKRNAAMDHGQLATEIHRLITGK